MTTPYNDRKHLIEPMSFDQFKLHIHTYEFRDTTWQEYTQYRQQLFNETHLGELPPCPNCEQQTLTAHTYTDTFIIGHQSLTIDNLQCCFCSNCNADPILPEQAHHNHALILLAKHNVKPA